MGYVQSTLLPGERIVYEGHISLWSMGPRITVGTLLLILGIAGSIAETTASGTPHSGSVILVMLGLVSLVTALMAYRTTELALTSKRVVAKFGVVRRHTVELSLARVESVQVRQGVLGRLLGYGSLVVAGAGVPSAPIPGISNPMDFRSMVFEAQEGTEPIHLKLAA
jgi:uncharacterized membrane protein YdbT with pleckstrin-like domain